MGRKPRLNKAARQRRREQRDKQQQDLIVHDTVASLSCSAETAADMKNHCDTRLADIDVDLTFETLAHEVWHGRAGCEELAGLIAELVEEQQRHAKAVAALAHRLQPLVTTDHGDHVHVDEEEVDPAHVRHVLFTLPEERPAVVERQISTESDRR